MKLPINQKTQAIKRDKFDTLIARVIEQECIAYPEAIRLFASGKLLVQSGIVKIKP